MNCQPGDLAMVVSGCQYVRDEALFGKVVRCIRLISEDDLMRAFGFTSEVLYPGMGLIWVTDFECCWAANTGITNMVPLMVDAALRPLRGFDPSQEQEDLRQLREEESMLAVDYSWGTQREKKA